jgi:hypothetical protein
VFCSVSDENNKNQSCGVSVGVLAKKIFFPPSIAIAAGRKKRRNFLSSKKRIRQSVGHAKFEKCDCFLYNKKKTELFLKCGRQIQKSIQLA